MTVLAVAPPTNYLSNMWNIQNQSLDRQADEILNIKSCSLPTLVSKRYQQSSHLHQGSTHLSNNASECQNRLIDESLKASGSNEFKSRLKPGIYKGNATGVAMDPEHHMQLVKEKQAMYEQRTRPKTPITLEPVHVLPLSRPKPKKTKAKNARLSRSAPELVQARNSKQELSSRLPTTTWTSENHLQLPLVSRDSNAGLTEIIKTNSTTTRTAKENISSATNASHSYPNNTNCLAPSPEPRLQIISTTHMNKLKPTKQGRTGIKPLLIQSLKNSQSNYAAFREQRLLTEKLRAYDNENLSVNAQPYRSRDVENILELVEHAQSQIRCHKQPNGRRACGICPPTAGPERKSVEESTHLPELSAASREETEPVVESARKELIIQLPNITYSRSNTPFL